MPHPNAEHVKGAPSATKGEDPHVLSTNSGAPIDNMLFSMTVGTKGPALMEDSILFENIQIHNRERIPERNVHARGTTAKGTLTITNPIPELTTAAFLQKAGATCPVAVRFSSVIHGIHSPEFLRDPRGFALKIYTQEGNYDIVGNNWPVFFSKDGMRFPDLVRALKPNPRTNAQEWWRILDYFSHFPESVHAIDYLTDDLGHPASYRNMNGWSINTFKFLDREGKATLFRWHFQSHQGEKGMRDEDVAGQHFSFHTIDLLTSIEKGDFPKWNLMFQAIDDANMPDDFDPLDATKEWPEERFPYRKVGEFVLNENVDSFFMENECIAFAPSRLVPGIAPSEDKLLASRLFAYVDTQRYRLGTNNQMLPINAPKCPFADNHVDGMMNFRLDSRGMREVNYFPSRETKFVHATGVPQDKSVIEQGRRVRETFQAPDEFKQPRERLRSLSAERRQRFVERWANILNSDRVVQEVRDIWLSNWTKADKEIGEKIQSYLSVLSKDPKTHTEEEKKIASALAFRKEKMTLTGPAF